MSWFIGYVVAEAPFSEQLNHFLWLYYEYRSGKIPNYGAFVNLRNLYLADQLRIGKLKIQEYNQFLHEADELSYFLRHHENMKTNGLSEMENLREAVHGLLQLSKTW